MAGGDLGIGGARNGGDLGIGDAREWGRCFRSMGFGVEESRSTGKSDAEWALCTLAVFLGFLVL